MSIRMKHARSIAAIVAFICAPWAGAAGEPPERPESPYGPTWTSLARHETPQWLRDAKFGIYTHLSLDTVKNIGGNEHRHKHELIDQFTLEKFDAAQWAELFGRAGAKFAGPVAWHGSGMLHWDSDITDCNTVQMGPGIDLLGELKREIYARDMKLIASFHTGYWYQAAIDRENPGRLDPQFADLYGPLHDADVTDAIPWKNHIEKQSKVTEEHSETWLAKMNEAVTKYQPDIAWVDVSFGGTVRGYNQGRYQDGKLISREQIYLNGMPETYQRRYIAHLFNTAAKHGKEVEFVYKEYDVPPGVGMRNIENGLIDTLAYDTWMTDIDICLPVSWFYKEGMGTRDANAIVDILVDVTAKNGILLLNVPPKPDGMFADEIIDTLHAVGDWLQINGEAIYGTMPWSIYGEGPSRLAQTGHYSEGKPNASYTVADFRFTQKGNTLYAICLGIPQGEVKIHSLGTRGRLFQRDIKSIQLLGINAPIRYRHNPTDLTLHMPAAFEGRHACVFKIVRRQ